jgi:hypothetical protein
MKIVSSKRHLIKKRIEALKDGEAKIETNFALLQKYGD